MSISIDIKNFNQQDINKIKRELCVKSKIDMFNKKRTIVETYKINKHTIDLPIYQAKKYIHEKKINKKDIINENINYKKMNMKFKAKLLNRQKDILDECKEKLNKYNCLFLSLYCGYGKTIMGTYLSSIIGLKTLIFTDRSLITQGWINTINKYTDKKLNIITNKITPDDINNNDIFIVGIDTANNLNDLKFLSNSFGTIIVDETLSYCTTLRVNTLLNYKPKYLIGLSADIERKDRLHFVLHHFFGTPDNFIRRISNKEFNVYKFNTPYKPTIRYLPFVGKIDWNTVIQSICKNDNRNDIIANLCKLNKYKKILILSKRIDHCTDLFNLLKKSNLDVDILTGNKKSYNNCDILISTYSKAGKGFDDINVCKNHDGRRIDLLFMVSDITQPEQYIGRVFRSHNPTVYYFVDDYSTFRNHWDRDIYTWCIKRNANIIEEWI